MSTPNVSIRRAASTDLDALAVLFDAYRVFYEKKSDPEGARRFLEDRLQNNDSIVFLAFDKHGEPLGFTQLYPLFSSVPSGPLDPLLISSPWRHTPTGREPEKGAG